MIDMNVNEPFKKSGLGFELTSWSMRQPPLTVGFTGRVGGNSAAPWQSLNMAQHVGDKPSDVIANRRKLTESLGWALDAWTCAEQVHGKDVVVVERAMRGRGRIERADALGEYDALVTSERDILLTSFYADCVPLYFWDGGACGGVVGLAHAGWKGTVANIAERTVRVIEERFSCTPDRLLCAIGPAIGACCYEVNDLVLDRVRNLIGSSQYERVTQPTRMGHARIDLAAVNRILLENAGVLAENISQTSYCTSCRTDLFFSHRAEAGSTGRMASWIGMKGSVTS